MSSTSAVSVLAQGLRELRDFAEGPDGEELRERTGLTAEQIDAALAGVRLPSREVTLALVEAWEGDVEAWRAYWGQIAELAEQDVAGQPKTTPAPPEPSIITPMPDEGAPEQAETETETDAEAEAEQEADDSEAEAIRAQSAARAQLEANAQAAKAQSEAMAAAAAHTESEDPEDTAKTETPVKKAAQAQTAAEPAAAKAAETPARAESPAAPEPEPKPELVKKSPLARISIPILLFAIGVGVGAFGDHALNSKQSSANTAASVPPVSTSARSSHTAALSPSGSPSTSPAGATDTSSSTGPNPTGATSPTEGSSSATSTVAPGTVLGAYVGIQLASGYSVNFLADPYHPAAGTSNGPDTMGFFAGSFVDGRFYANRVAILDPTDTGSFTSCLNDTRYQHDVLLSQISTGSSFCITTGTGHLVLVTVRRMPSSTDANPYAVLDVTVWQGS